MWAVESGDLDTVRLCLQYGADINVENKFTKTALEIASDKGFTEVYDMLLVIWFLSINIALVISKVILRFF